MRRNIITLVCLALFLQTNLFAQMQGIISYSSERHSRAIQPFPKTIVVENYTNDTIITLCRDGGMSYFCKTALNSSLVEYGIMPQNIDIFDFKIYNSEIIMCGKNANNNSNTGFIGVININDLFAGVGVLQCYEVGHTDIVYDMEYYTDVNGHLKVATLAQTRPSGYAFVDYNLSTSSHYVYPTQYTLYRLTQTKNYIATVFSEPNATEFGIMRHDKNNVFNYQSEIWRFAGGYVYSSFGLKPEERGTYFLIENIDNTDEVCVAATVKDHPFSLGGVPIVVYHIDVNTLNLNSTQVIQSYGKTHIKDMEYIPYDETLHIINNTDVCYVDNGDTTIRYSIDVIHKAFVYPTTLSYLAEIIVPNNSQENAYCMNSIVKYTDNHYIIGGKSSTYSSLYWFDKNYTNLNDYCYEIYDINAYLSTATPIGNITYIGYIHSNNITHIPCFGTNNTFWFLQCLD